MSSQEILNYIKENLANGYSKEDIKNALMSAGWESSQIDEAFSSFDKPQKEPEEEKPVFDTGVQKEGERVQDVGKEISVDGAIMSPEGNIGEEKKKSPLDIKFLILGGVLALLLVSFFAWFLFFRETASLEERLVEKVNNMENLNSFNVSYEIFLNAEEGGDEFEYTLNLDTKIDKINNSFSSSGGFDFRLEDNWGGMFLGANLSSVYKEGDFYLKIEDIDFRIPSIEEDFFYFLEQAGEEEAELFEDNFNNMIDNLKEIFTGRYVLISEDFEEDFFDFYGLEGGSVDVDKYMDFFETPFNEEISLGEMFTEDAIEVLEYRDDQVDGVSATRYKVALKEKPFLDNLIFALGKLENMPEAEIFYQEISQVKEDLIVTREETQEGDVFSNINIWANEDHVLKIEFSSREHLEEHKREEMFDGIDVDFDIILEFKDFNKDFNIERPGEFLTLQELFEEFMAYYLDFIFEIASNEERLQLIKEIEYLAALNYEDEGSYEGTKEEPEILMYKEMQAVDIYFEDENYCASIEMLKEQEESGENEKEAGFYCVTESSSPKEGTRCESATQGCR